MKKRAIISAVKLPVTAAVTIAVTDQNPLRAAYILTSVVIRPAAELSNPGLESQG